MSTTEIRGIDNWPPGFPHGTGSPPEGLCQQLRDAYDRIEAIENEVAEWRAGMRRRQTDAWTKWHAAAPLRAHATKAVGEAPGAESDPWERSRGMSEAMVGTPRKPGELMSATEAMMEEERAVRCPSCGRYRNEPAPRADALNVVKEHRDYWKAAAADYRAERNEAWAERDSVLHDLNVMRVERDTLREKA